MQPTFEEREHLDSEIRQELERRLWEERSDELKRLIGLLDTAELPSSVVMDKDGVCHVRLDDLSRIVMRAVQASLRFQRED